MYDRQDDMEHGADRQELQELWRSIRIDALRRGADDHTADDVVQETWLRALQKPPEDRGRFRGWLHVVARRYLRELRGTESHRLRRERWVARTETAPPASAEDTPLVFRYVDELPEPYRGVIRLRFFEDREVEEIATLLGRPPETVRSQLKRGLERLRVRLGARPRSRIERFIGLGWIRFLSRKSLGEGRAVPRRLALSILGIAVVVLGWTLWSTTSREAAAGRLGSVAAAFDMEQRGSLAPTPLPPEPRESIETSAAVAFGPEPSGTFLAGIVRDPAGSPVPGARVWAGAAGSSAATHSVLADERGSYRIEVGRNDIVWASLEDWCDSNRCYVACVKEQDELDLFLSPTRGMLEVVVVDHGGAPVPEALVQFDPQLDIEQHVTTRGTLEFVAPSPPARTDEHGRARLAIPRREFAMLTVVPPTLPAWAEEIVLTDGPEPLTVTLPMSTPLRGTLVDDAGPAWHAQIVVLQLEGLVQREAVTASDGTFEIEGLTRGEFVVRALEDPLSGTRSARAAGVLTEGEPVELELRLTSSSTLRSRIIENGVPSAGTVVTLRPVRANAAEGPLERTARTDSRGRFVFGSCGFQDGYVLRAGATGHQPTFETLILGPQEDRAYEVAVDPADFAPIVVEFSGATELMPLLTELRRTSPCNSIMLWPESGGSRFRSEPLPRGKYAVVAWITGLGAWHPGGLEHGPAAPAVHRIRLPEPTNLEVELELPDDVLREDVEVLVETHGLNYFGIGSFGKPVGYRELAWDAERSSYSAEVLPGACKLIVRGVGLAPIRRPLQLAARTVNRIPLTAVAGTRIRLVFHAPRGPMPSEFLHLYTTEEDRRTFPPRLLHLTEDGFEILATVPLTTTELRVVTEQREQNAEILSSVEMLGPTVLVGTHKVTYDELHPDEGLPRVEFELVEQPK